MEESNRRAVELEGASRLALEDFGELTSGEQKILIGCQRGVGPVLSSECPKFPEKIAPADNVIRGSFLRFLALGGDSKAPTHKTGIMVQGAWIVGSLNLNGMETLPISLNLCRFEQPAIFKGTHVCGALWLKGCYLLGLQAEELKCDSGLFLDNTETWGKVDINGASIGGQFSARGAIWHRLPPAIQADSNGNFHLIESEEDVLSAERIVVNGNAVLDQGFVASGGIRLGGAKISGQLNMVGATLGSKPNNSLAISMIR